MELGVEVENLIVSWVVKVCCAAGRDATRIYTGMWLAWQFKRHGDRVRVRLLFLDKRDTIFSLSSQQLPRDSSRVKDEGPKVKRRTC